MTEEEREQEERERQLGVIRERWSKAETALPVTVFTAHAKQDIDFLLSMLDSQATARLAAETQISIDANKQRDAATAMRDACVEKVRRKADSYQKDSERPDFLPNYKKQMAFTASALKETATELESLTLDQVEQEKQS